LKKELLLPADTDQKDLASTSTQNRVKLHSFRLCSNHQLFSNSVHFTMNL